MQALLLAARDRIRSALSYANSECNVRPDGMPDPACGEVFVAIHPGVCRNDSDLSLDEYVGVNVTLTMRASWLPVDQSGPELAAKASTGLYARAEAIRALLHMNYTVMDDANTTIGGSENGFVEPLKYRSMGTPQAKGPDWFSAEDEYTPPAGWAIEIVFDDARRIQVIEEQS